MNTRLGRGRAFRLAVCLALVAALSGCMQLNLGLTVNADDTVDGQLLLTAEKSLLSQRKGGIPTAFAELRQNIPTLPAGTESRYEDSRFYGIQIAYREKPLAEFTSESVNLVRDGDLYRFTLPLDPKKYGGKVAEQDPRNQQAFMQLMSFEISVTFPGRVIDSNGTVNGRSVSWKVIANQPKPPELRAIAEAPPKPSASGAGAAAPAGEDSSFPWLPVAGGVLLLLLVAVVVVLLLRRRGPATAPPAATPATAPPAASPTTAPPADQPGPV
ncbi:DUF3153 domain-containing protein [Micromonospora sp. 4G57]|uniref:DUF3153 domain-containing protein n=1 Tax=Micromonospora sicca TaxID=2202420 RepID=A0ABU5JHK0_9ACTN|nr:MULTISPECIES: DUF3153 domain-containing protein [unclassified Micromonospora]MDZ5442155.1 DUF3153 domain-containing protein [Micromonospora sp. 4G57]MDZ5492102.1 DUF3153 domain-containing protein [Micromonospora sp. 4G53]